MGDIRMSLILRSSTYTSKKPKTIDVGTSDKVAIEISRWYDMENITTPEPSWCNIFKDEVKMIMDALSTQIKVMHIFYKGLHWKIIYIDERQKALFSMISDMYSQYRSYSNQPPQQWLSF